MMRISHTAGESCLMRRIPHLLPSAIGKFSGFSGEEFWGCAMGIAQTAGKSRLTRRTSHLIRSASGSMARFSGREFWEWAIFRGTVLFCGPRGAVEVIDVVPITCSCGQCRIVGLRKIIGVAYVFHVTSGSGIIEAAAGDVGTIRSLVAGVLVKKQRPVRVEQPLNHPVF